MIDAQDEALQPADTFATSTAVGTVFDHVLSLVHDGTVLPGQRIGDLELAQRLGVSLAPVREALFRLREIGIIETTASGFTRVAIVTPQQTADAMVVWLALYGALIDEVIGTVAPDVVAAMRAEHENFLAQVLALNMQKIATSNADFFAHLMALSSNSTLLRGLISVVHLIRLGSLHLPDYIDFHRLAESQNLLVLALRDGNKAAAHGAIRMLSTIRVPTAPIE